MNAYDEFRAQFDTDEATARAALDQLLESTGWGNAVMLQLTRLRKAVKALNDAVQYVPVNKAWDKVDEILAEPTPQPVDISNHFTDMVKDLQCQVRELEVANAALQARNDELTSEVSNGFPDDNDLNQHLS